MSILRMGILEGRGTLEGVEVVGVAFPRSILSPKTRGEAGVDGAVRINGPASLSVKALEDGAKTSARAGLGLETVGGSL